MKENYKLEADLLQKNQELENKNTMYLGVILGVINRIDHYSKEDIVKFAQKRLRDINGITVKEGE